MAKSGKVDIIRFEKYMKPSGCCQACLSQAQLAKDCIITCDICRSCIHQTHYGSELLQPPQVWQCERCRYFLQNGPKDIYCEFCPNLRGIMKQYLFQNRKIWLHPQCAVWGFPIIFFMSQKKQGIRKEKPKNESTNFWVRDYETNENPCQVCRQMYGYRIKCKYYSCKKSYHVTCARPQGIVRDLESMKIQNGAGYFPVYCKDHIQLKIQDCRKRVKLLKQKGDTEKAAHFHKIANLFVDQLKNLENSVKKCKLEEQMIKKISLQTRRNIEGHGNANFTDLDESFSSQQSNQFLNFLQQQMIDQTLPLKAIQSIRIIIPDQKNNIKQEKITKSKLGGGYKGSKQQKQQKISRQYSQIVPISTIQVQVPVSAPSIANHTISNQTQENPNQMEQEKNKKNGYEQMFQDF